MGVGSEYLGDYRIHRTLASGGMGTALLAEDRRGRPVVVKVIRPEFANDPGFRARFSTEVAAARQVPRFCTAPVIDADLDGDVLYVVTEYVNGPSLQALVTKRGPLPPGELDGVAAGIAAALTAIHDAGIIHRDLKPGNVMLSLFGPRVIDFGIARPVSAVDGPTPTGMVLGTPAFMAPEQFRDGHLTRAVDVFAWGAVMAYAATGSPPFGLATDWMAVAYRVVNERPHLDGVHDPLRDLVERALSKEADQRPTAKQLLDTLVRNPEAVSVLTHASDRPAEEPPPTPPVTVAPVAEAPARRPRRRLVIGAIAVSVTTVVAGTSYLALTPYLTGDHHHGDQAKTGTRDQRHDLDANAGTTTPSPSSGPSGGSTGGATSGTHPTAGPGTTRQPAPGVKPSTTTPSNGTRWTDSKGEACAGYTGVALQGGPAGNTVDIQLCTRRDPARSDAPALMAAVLGWTAHGSNIGSGSSGEISLEIGVYTCAGGAVPAWGSGTDPEGRSNYPVLDNDSYGRAYQETDASSYYADGSVSMLDYRGAGHLAGTLHFRTACRAG
ncbi:MAG: serine/threonine-protein kinase [Mycobacteriales bacterium]